MKRKCILISLIILTLILSAFSLCACHWTNRQRDMVNVVWQTDDNEYGIALTFTVLDHSGDNYGTFKYENKEYDIRMGWEHGKVFIYPIGYYGNNVRSDDKKEIRLSGTYKIKEKGVVEITFYTVYVDFEEFKPLNDKKITVRATDIDPDESDVGDISEVMWQSKDSEWKIYTYFAMRRFSVGTYGVGENKTDVVVFWLNNNRFKAYKLKDGVPPDGGGEYVDLSRIDGDAFIVGTYTNDSKQLHLTYTLEVETQLRFSILYCQKVDNYLMDIHWYPSSSDAVIF